MKQHVIEDFRKQFPAAQNYTYLNTASSGLMSAKLSSWRAAHDQEFVLGGSVFRDDHKQFLGTIRNSVAHFFDAKLNEVALIPNFSFALNTLLEGIPKGKKVLLLDRDYPSINWAFEKRDFEICFATIDSTIEQNIEQAVSRHRPDIFAFSIVQYLNGIKIDLDFLKQLKAYHPELLLIADGTQYLGTEAFSFQDSAIDILGASAYKWMLSGYGNGVFMVKEGAQKDIKPRTIGFNSAEAIFGNRDTISFMKHFEPGHQDTLNYGSLGKSLEFFNEVGILKIASYLSELTTKAKASFIEMGLLDESSTKRESHSTIFNLQGNEVAFQKLTAAKILCSQRGNGIRVSFHLYNNEEDIHKLLDCF